MGAEDVATHSSPLLLLFSQQCEETIYLLLSLELGKMIQEKKRRCLVFHQASELNKESKSIQDILEMIQKWRQNRWLKQLWKWTVSFQ